MTVSKLHLEKIRTLYPASLAPDMELSDGRQQEWKDDRRSVGYDFTELWNLDMTFLQLMYPRILDYVEYAGDIRTEKTTKDYKILLDSMKWLIDHSNDALSDEVDKKWNKVLKLFSKYIRGMWI